MRVPYNKKSGVVHNKKQCNTKPIRRTVQCGTKSVMSFVGVSLR
jgi:hypothetical protein